jgi:GTP-binding protein
MKIQSARFVQSAPGLRDCPEWNRAEFALIGRSNVGKSSLVNLLTNQRSLAKVSDRPGKTQLLNFFLLNEAWSLVDLPGYGYAAVGKHRRADFNEAVADYLEHRPNLREVFMLLDSRLPPQAIDLEFLRWLVGVRVPWTLVFTKADKQSAARTQSAVAEFRRAIAPWAGAAPRVLVSSAVKGTGRAEILGRIGAVLEAPDDAGS